MSSSLTRMTEDQAKNLTRGHRLTPHPDESSKMIFRDARQDPSIWFEFIALSVKIHRVDALCCRVDSHNGSGSAVIEHTFYCYRFCSPMSRIPIDRIIKIWLDD